MKIVITDDNGNIIYEQDNPGYMHLPIIMDGMHDFCCEDDDCKDPRCVERAQEATELVHKWLDSGENLAFYYHFSNSSEADPKEFEKLPNSRIPKKVALQAFHGDEVVFTSGETVRFLQPRLNVYGRDQVMFETDKWGASLVPWGDHHDMRTRQVRSRNG
jgi:hypothetical protein